MAIPGALVNLWLSGDVLEDNLVKRWFNADLTHRKLHLFIFHRSQVHFCCWSHCVDELLS
jgi:hypothetical protein